MRVNKDKDAAIPELAKRLEYDPGTGQLTWLRKETSGRVSNWWNTKYAGKPAGHANHRGYLLIQFKPASKCYAILAHRVAWYCITGKTPEFNIDHIDGNPSNNRAENLRDVPSTVNMRNTKHRCNNTSGVTGMCWDKAAGKWQAQAKENGTQIYLGKFTCKKEAETVTREFRERRGYSGRCYLEDVPCSGTATQ